MRLPMKLTTAAISALALGGAIAGTAVAAGSAVAQPIKVHAVVSEPTGPDTDAIQQGDQTGADSLAAATTSVNGENPGEGAGEQQPSDGPGGHADPAGDVQHEFSGVE